MDISKYLTVLVMLCFDGGETGGHGGSHHNHVKLHMPEFIHHDLHTKVITIHHHHQKPKKEHHHHHHLHKPLISHIPHGHHYQHHHKKSHTKLHTTTTKGHHGHHGHGHHSRHAQQVHHGHHGNYGHHAPQGHGHHGRGHGHHHEAPAANYDSDSSSFEDDYGLSYGPPPAPAPAFGGGAIPQIPQVHGIQQTLKQVKVFDSLPGLLANAGIAHGYQVTEEGAEEDDAYTSVKNVQQAPPAMIGYLQGLIQQQAAPDPFAQLAPQTTLQTHNPFVLQPQPTSGLTGIESFAGIVQNNPFGASDTTQGAFPSAQSSPEVPVSFQGDGGFDNPANSFTGDDGEATALFSSDDEGFHDETPSSFSREAGVQQTVNTGEIETVVY